MCNHRFGLIFRFAKTLKKVRRLAPINGEMGGNFSLAMACYHSVGKTVYGQIYKIAKRVNPNLFSLRETCYFLLKIVVWRWMDSL